MFRYFVAVAALLIAKPARAAYLEAPADEFFSQACLPTVTCIWTFRKTGKATWEAEFDALDNKPGGPTWCSYKVVLRPGIGQTTDGTEFPGLVGAIGKGKVSVMTLDPETVFTVADVDTCEKSKLPLSRGILGVNGVYEIGGDS